MTIDANKSDKTTAILTLSGRLDTANATLLERKIKQFVDEVSDLILDFAELEYISSMGLRVLLQTQKTMKQSNRRMVIKNMKEAVREVFEMTGFINLMVQDERFVMIRKDEAGSVVLSLNGDMKPEDVPSVSKELSEIRIQKNHTPVTVVLDMANLYHIFPNVLKHLNQAIDDTAWDGRKLELRNVSGDLKKVFADEKMEYLYNESSRI